MARQMSPRLSVDWEGLAARTAALARGAGRLPSVTSVTVPAPPIDPVALFARAASLTGFRILWVAPRGEQSMVGLGAAAVIEAEGPAPLRQVEAAWAQLAGGAVAEGPPGAWGTGPVLLGGIAFDPAAGADPVWAGFPAARFVLPAVLYTRNERGAWLTVTRAPGGATFEAAAAPAVTVPQQGAGSGESPAVRVPAGPAAQEWEEWLSRLDEIFQDSAAGAPGRAGDAGGATPTPAPGGDATVVDEHPGPGPWREAVERALAAIARGELRKVVLSRRVRVRAGGPFDVAAVLQRLRAGYPDCFLFCIPGGDAHFLGASPERLARLRAGRLETAAVAGSTRRGETAALDRELGRALLADPKERAEHALVVEMLREALAPLCEALDIPEEPVLLRLGNVQHLYTPVRGTVRGRSVLEIVERLHPTPAMGGQPRDAAMRFIRRHEPMPRGWYAAPVGWFDRHGEGEFAVAIRSGLLRGKEAWLFAGCGIVAGSDPQREYEETRLKLQPLLSALEAGQAMARGGWE